MWHFCSSHQEVQSFSTSCTSELALWLEWMNRMWQKWYYGSFNDRLPASALLSWSAALLSLCWEKPLSFPHNPEPIWVWVNTGQDSRKVAPESHRIVKNSILLLLEISVYRMQTFKYNMNKVWGLMHNSTPSPFPLVSTMLLSVSISFCLFGVLVC